MAVRGLMSACAVTLVSLLGPYCIILFLKKVGFFFFSSRCFILKVIRIRNNLVNPPRLREKSEREVACQPCVVMSRQQGEFLVLGGSNSPSRRSIETDPGNPSSPLLF